MYNLNTRKIFSILAEILYNQFVQEEEPISKYRSFDSGIQVIDKNIDNSWSQSGLGYNTLHVALPRLQLQDPTERTSSSKLSLYSIAAPSVTDLLI